jgi:hypothetical protein
MSTKELESEASGFKFPLIDHPLKLPLTLKLLKVLESNLRSQWVCASVVWCVCISLSLSLSLSPLSLSLSARV